MSFLVNPFSSAKANNLIGYNSTIKYQKTKYKKIVVNTAKEKILVSANKILRKIN